MTIVIEQVLEDTVHSETVTGHMVFIKKERFVDVPYESQMYVYDQENWHRSKDQEEERRALVGWLSNHLFY